MGNCNRTYFAIALPLLLTACMNDNHEPPEVHGHRGCRGLMPENTIAAFEKAAHLGCEWLEMDVVITADNEVLVSHEPWMSHVICRTADGDSIPADEERDYNIFKMKLAEVQAFDCGSAHHSGFPLQENEEEHKPTLREVVEKVDRLSMEEGLGNVNFNIEIKSDPALYGTYQPEPVAFARRVMEMIDSLNITDRAIIQSFDPAVLEAVHRIDEEIPIALLVDNGESLDANLERITFKPTYYSPAFVLMDEKLITSLRERDIEALVWTVNDEADMNRMIALGVNGIITDYPDRLIKLLDAE